MNLPQSQLLQPESKDRARTATLFGVITAAIFGIAAFYTLSTGSAGQLWYILPVLFASLALIWLSGLGRSTNGAAAFIGVVLLQVLIPSLFLSGLGITNAIISVALIGGVALAALPQRSVGRVLLVGLAVSIAGLLTDQFGPLTRPPAGYIDLRWGIAISVLASFTFFFVREFASLDIRTKIVIGILTTGGVSLGVLAIFAFNRGGQITTSISRRLETSVRLLAEEQLANKVFTEANLANQYFTDTSEEVSSLAFTRGALQARRDVLNTGSYWDANSRLVLLNGGQYGNSPQDTASVFVPVNTMIDEAVIADLNTTAYLDLSAPGMLASNSSILAIYYIDYRGLVRYYPNINLASILPPDFDATSRPYYKITTPLFNPDRLTRWTIPYVDAAGGGLVVTVAAPVYFGEEFNGVVAADIQLAQITQQVSSIKVGQSGYAFMIDDAGRIISMPPSGYAMFGINPNELPAEEYFKQTVLGAGSEDLGSIVRRMVVGGSGLNVIDVGGVDTYITFSPVKENGYSLALVVPVSEMQGAIAVARDETLNQIQSTVRVGALIFIGLLMAAMLVSLGIGQIIATPIIRLTRTANQIVEGDVTSQARVTSRDEIGSLAQAFNTMTARLRETLAGLELRVQARTSELVAANEQIQRRARQFEAIADVARVINKTQALKDLLPQITQAISGKFGFYHVGIFLLDVNNEFAVLAAANSQGGQRMLARNHRLKVGQVGIVGYVAGSGAPRIALDTGADAVFFNNPDLPETRSEIALPLTRIGSRPIGVLDVQSTEPNAFGAEDIQILSTLAEQVALAIENARLFEQTQKALSEAELLYLRDLKVGWSKLSESQRIAGVLRRGMKTSFYNVPVELPGGPEVLRTGRSFLSNDGAMKLTLPVKLRGEVVGLLNVTTETDRLTDDQLDIVNAIVERAALAIESARLLQEAQRRAAKERAIGDISAKIGSLVNIENILETALLELGSTLPNTDIAIQFSPDRVRLEE